MRVNIRKRVFYWFVAGCLAIAIVVIACCATVGWRSSGRHFQSVEDMPRIKLGLVLGTSPYTSDGSKNFSFVNRIDAAAELYEAGKVKKFVVSGGDYSELGDFNYDEPQAMRDSLIAHGVRAEDIFMDREGTNTIRSIAKLKQYYGYSDTVAIISQGYHNSRSIVMADSYGLPAVGFDADMPVSTLNNIKNLSRESLARVKLFYSLYISPKLTADVFTSADLTEFRSFLDE